MLRYKGASSGEGEARVTDIAGLVDVEDISKTAYALSHVSKIREVLDLADGIYSGYPRALRDLIKAENTPSASVNYRLAMALAELPPNTRAAIRVMVEELDQHIAEPIDCDPDGNSYGVLSETEMKIITAMVIFVQRLGKSSATSLLNALEASNSGDWNFILIQAKGRDSEVHTRRRLSPSTKAEFQIE